MGQERTWVYCREKYFNITQELIKHYYETCPVCLKKNPVTQPARGSRKPTRSINFRDRFQIDLIDFCKLRKRDPFGVLMHWVLVIKDHATGLVYLCALPRKVLTLLRTSCRRYFGSLAFPRSFIQTMGKSSPEK